MIACALFLLRLDPQWTPAIFNHFEPIWLNSRGCLYFRRPEGLICIWSALCGCRQMAVKVLLQAGQSGGESWVSRDRMGSLAVFPKPLQPGDTSKPFNL